MFSPNLSGGSERRLHRKNARPPTPPQSQTLKRAEKHFQQRALSNATKFKRRIPLFMSDLLLFSYITYQEKNSSKATERGQPMRSFLVVALSQMVSLAMGKKSPLTSVNCVVKLFNSPWQNVRDRGAVYVLTKKFNESSSLFWSFLADKCCKTTRVRAAQASPLKSEDMRITGTGVKLNGIDSSASGWDSQNKCAC